jgi:putative hemolysin
MSIHIAEQFSPAPFTPLRQGEYSIAIAQTPEEVRAALALRYEVFYEGLGAGAGEDAPSGGYDSDPYDAVCDHLLVRYHAPEAAEPRIVGTYRLLRDEARAPVGQFYSEDEYDLSVLKRYDGRLMELGRSCIHPEFRSKAAMQLLWRGIGEYVMHHGIDLMFGCASFHGSNPDDHAQSLSYLYHHHLAPESLRPRTLDAYYADMNRMPAEAIDQRRAFFKLPVLIKGYLRLGGVVGDGAFLDHDFNTTDVMIVVETRNVDSKYVSRYAPDSVEGGA